MSKQKEFIRNFIAGMVPRPAKGTNFDVPCQWPDQCGCLACVRIATRRRDRAAADRERARYPGVEYSEYY